MVLGMLLIVFGDKLLWLFNTDPLVIRYGMIRVVVMCSCYFLASAIEIIGNHIRGMGYSTLPTVINLVGICVVRVLYILFVYPVLPQGMLPFFQDPAEQLFFYVIIIYPVSYVIVMAGLFVAWGYYTRKMYRTMGGLKQ